MSDQLEDLKPEEVTVGDRPLSIPSELPILPLRDTVLFPNSFMPLAVARESSVRLIDDAIANGKLIAVFTQRDAAVEEPSEEDLYRIGTATHIHKMFKLPDGSLRLIVQGLARHRQRHERVREQHRVPEREHRDLRRDRQRALGRRRFVDDAWTLASLAHARSSATDYIGPLIRPRMDTKKRRAHG